MKIKRGIPVSSGVVVREAFILDTQESHIPRRLIPASEIDSEVARLESAITQAIEGVRESQRQAADKIGQKYLSIFDSHAIILDDPSLKQQIIDRIRNENVTAEFAASKVLRSYIRALLATKYTASRVPDVHDVQKRLLAELLGEKRELLSNLSSPVVVIAHDLTPSDTVNFDKERVSGFATNAGGRTSHTAIMARAMGIPAVVGLSEITAEVTGGDWVIIDGNTGTVIIDPTEEVLHKYQLMELDIRMREKALAVELHDLPAETLDGHKINIHGNIEFPEEIKAAREKGAEGIGLYRTEYLYVQPGANPGEEEHYQAYKMAAEAMWPDKDSGNSQAQPVTIRTLDLAGDKFMGPAEASEADSRNPLLGCRSIRFTLERQDIFRIQLRAILRASRHGNVRVLFPMISALSELLQAKQLLEEVRAELIGEGLELNKDLPVGIMVEVPSAAATADLLAKEVDFFSIGTNDLVQYTLAVDRSNQAVAGLYQPAHPAVLRLVKQVIDVGRRNRIPVAMCGEMSGDAGYTMLLLGLGLKEFSVAPAAIPEIKKMIRSINMDQAKEVADKVMQMKDPSEIVAFLREQTEQFSPEVF